LLRKKTSCRCHRFESLYLKKAVSDQIYTMAIHRLRTVSYWLYCTVAYFGVVVDGQTISKNVIGTRRNPTPQSFRRLIPRKYANIFEMLKSESCQMHNLRRSKKTISNLVLNRASSFSFCAVLIVLIIACHPEFSTANANPHSGNT